MTPPPSLKRQKKAKNSNGGWNDRYEQYGHMWGDEPSVCGMQFAKVLKPGSKVLDFGCGYARDTKYLAEHGHRPMGVDLSMKAIRLADEFLSDSGSSAVNDRVSFYRGDIIEAPLVQDNFDAVLSHRTLHLPHPAEVSIIVKRVAEAMKEKGLLIATARSRDDFNPEQMVMLDDGITFEYKDRPGHRVYPFNEDRFRALLSPYFTELSFFNGTEPESVYNVGKDGEPVMTKYIGVTARKKTASEFEQESNKDTPLLFSFAVV